MRDDTTSGGIALQRLRSAATACLSPAIILAIGTAARAQFDVETKLTAFDAAELDYFGVSVGISGGTAIVGAYFDDDAGNGAGSAYLFTTSSPLSDLTGNGFVDFEDLTVLLADWTGPAPAASPEAALGTEAVPEPSTFVLAALAIIGFGGCRDRSRRWERNR